MTKRVQTQMLNKYPDVTVVVVNAKGLEYLEKCLRSLVETDYPNFEIIVVDCQTFGIADWIAQHFQEVKVVHFEKDIGPSASHNIGIAKASPTSKYVAFLDNDTIVEPDWLRELVEVAQKYSKAGIVQAKILKMNRKDELHHTGLALDSLGTWVTTLNMDAKGFNEVLEIFAASSAACIVRRDVFDEAGGFDEDYFIYDDDTDFSWRVRLLGYKTLFAPLARVYHFGQIPRASLQPNKIFNGVKNRGCTLLKNYELSNVWWRMGVYNLALFAAAIASALALRLMQAHALLKGLAYLVLNFHAIWRKRAEVQVGRQVNDEELFRRKLLRKGIHATLSFSRNIVPLAVVRKTRRVPRRW